MGRKKLPVERTLDEPLPTHDGCLIQTGKLGGQGRTVYFTCAYCHENHVHGRPALPMNLDHKVAHCDERTHVLIFPDGTRYQNSDGYYVQLDEESVEELYQTGIVPRPDQPPLQRIPATPMPAPRVPDPVAAAPAPARKLTTMEILFAVSSPDAVMTDELRAQAEQVLALCVAATANAFSLSVNAIAQSLRQQLALPGSVSRAALANTGLLSAVGMSAGKYLVAMEKRRPGRNQPIN